MTFVTVLSYDFNEGVEEFHTKFAQHYPSRVEAKFWGSGGGLREQRNKARSAAQIAERARERFISA